MHKRDRIGRSDRKRTDKQEQETGCEIAKKTKERMLVIWSWLNAV